MCVYAYREGRGGGLTEGHHTNVFPRDMLIGQSHRTVKKKKLLKTLPFKIRVIQFQILNKEKIWTVNHCIFFLHKFNMNTMGGGVFIQIEIAHNTKRVQTYENI